MLLSLDIRDLLIIEKMSLDFQPGLNVLTGETGAGKSILLDALGCVLGWRGRADLVRDGAEQGEVTAEFVLGPDHPAIDVLATADIAPDDGQIVLRRVVTASGRKTAFINDRRVGGELLRQLSDTLVELHGQHDDRGLLNARGHRRLLDSFGGLERQVAQSAQLWRDHAKAQLQLQEAQAAAAAIKAEEDFLRHAFDELSRLDPQPGEEETLDRARRLMQASEKVGAEIAQAEAALGREGAEGNLSDALRWLEGAAHSVEDVLDDAMSAISRALSELAEAQARIEDALRDLRFDPLALENCEERLFAIRAAARKYQVLPEELPAKAREIGEQMARLEASDGDLAELSAKVDSARRAYETAAEKLSMARATAGKKLDRAMAGELTPLKMERALFQTAIAPGEPGPEGTDHVSFTVATNPGAPAGPLDKIASGGELSRFLLALKVCLTAGQPGLTMIFDEIDRGVGGATADAVGRRLAALAQGAQVLVVTHSPQVAARGTHHWQVAKSVKSGRTTSQVVALDAQQRVDELARMLSGDTITPEARSAAIALLEA